MRTDRMRWTALLLMLLTLLVSIRSGADYEISRHTIDGGGGISSGGHYMLTGTIGQPDADWSSGGSYEVLGGVWLKPYRLTIF